MKIITYNVNGIRSALSKGWAEWVLSTGADLLLLQEVKAEPGQADLSLLSAAGYSFYWHPAEKKGYSGVAIFSRLKPRQVITGSGEPEIDREGRILRVDFDSFSVMSVYIPSGSSGDDRQQYKMEWLEWFSLYVKELRLEIPRLLIGGDVNICHRPIDIHNPVSNANSSGFLPEERAWFDQFLESGFVDCFRELNPQPHQYTWWSYRANARANNKGWRIDYFLSTENLRQALVSCHILSQAKHSDHCPVLLEVELTD